MDNLFKNDTTFTQVPLVQLARCFLDEGKETIGIAGFQRNAVWKENKVEDLWDSILCQFPIGSLMLARYDAFSEGGYRTPQLFRSDHVQDTQMKEHGVDYIVVDGQQRLNAIALGFMPYDHSNSARLWLEMEAPLDGNNRQFEFYLCTRDNPFGAGLSPDQRRQTYALIDRDEYSENLGLDETYPFHGRIAFPFYELCQFLEYSDKWETLLSFIETMDLKGSARDRIIQKLQNAPVPVQFSGLAQTIRMVIHEGKYLVPVTQIKKHGPWMNAQKLGKLFERVNISGEVPPQSELFFSALKLRYPQINNYVSEIYNSPPVKRLLSPTDLIFIALRMVDPSITVLQIARFEKIVKEKGDELVLLLEKTGGDLSIFGRCIQWAYKALHHTGESGDIGLPRQYLARLRPRVWQTISIWLLRNREYIETHGIDQQHRLDLLRFAVMDAHNYFLGWRRGFSSYITSPTFMLVLSNVLGNNADFPVSELLSAIWKKARNDKYSHTLVSPKSYREKIQVGELVENRFELPNEDFFLLYAQRQDLEGWENQRLDIDHIAPAVWMYFTGYYWKNVWLLDEKLYDYRGKVLNCSGNKRFWPESLNRSSRNLPPGKKYIHSHQDEQTDTLHSHFHLATVEGVLTASAIDQDQADGWASLACNNSKVWDVERFTLFKRLTDERRCRIFQQFYDALQMDSLFSTLILPED